MSDPGPLAKTYPEGGHIPMEEFPEETARDAFAFLSDDAPPASPTIEPRIFDDETE